MTIEKRISDWIDSHRDEFLRDVARMVAIESVGGESAPDAPFGPGPRAALDEMLKLCGEYGFATDIYHGAMGSVDYNGKAARLDILGHLDVVGPGDGWDTDPYKATLKDDGCLYGRGTDDDKGPVVEALYAMRCLKELGVELEHGCRLLFGTDEETGSGDLHYYYDEHEPAPNTFTPDTGFPVYNVEKGMYRPVITRSWPGEAGQPRLVSAQGGFRINVVPAEAKAVIEGLDAPGALKFAGPCADKCGVELIASDTPAGCEILVRGKQTHAAYPQSGINAVTALLAVIFRPGRLLICASRRVRPRPSPRLHPRFRFPAYPYSVIFMFGCLAPFITFMFARENNDAWFTAILPVKKRETVKAKCMLIIAVQLGQLIISVPFAPIGCETLLGFFDKLKRPLVRGRFAVFNRIRRRSPCFRSRWPDRARRGRCGNRYRPSRCPCATAGRSSPPCRRRR